MSLRKSPKLTSDALAANRANAAKSTGPRTAAGKARARHNALQHGRRAASDVSRETMLALGEDPEEFEDLYQSLLRAYEPADPLWAKQVEDLAKLYWRRGRLERARDALLRGQIDQPQLEHQRRLVEIERSTFPDTEDGMVDITQPIIHDPVAKFRLALSYWQLIRRQVARGYFHRRQRYLLEWSVGEVSSWRRRRIDNLLWQLTPDKNMSSNPMEENGHQRLIELLDEEITEIREAFENALRESEEASPVARDALLAPNSDRWEALNSQENNLQRAIDRKTRILHAHMRLRGTLSNPGKVKRPAPQVRSKAAPEPSTQQVEDIGH